MACTRLLSAFVTAVFCVALARPATAQYNLTPEEKKDDRIAYNVVKPPGQVYWSSGLEGSLFQTAFLSRPGLTEARFSTLRYSFVFNVNFNQNYNFTNSLGLLLPISVKNIGLTDKMGDSTVKRRSYNLGAGLGLKVGNMKRHLFGFVGGGADLPFNYREKGFVKRSDKNKFSEWFSDRMPAFMPFVSAGLSIYTGATVKVQYYPGNFLNVGFTGQNPGTGLPYKPYAGYHVKLIYFSLGYNLNYKKELKEGYRDMGQPSEKGL